MREMKENGRPGPGAREIILEIEDGRLNVVHAERTTAVDPDSGCTKRERSGKGPSRAAILEELERRRDWIESVAFGHVRLVYKGDEIVYVAIEVKFRPERKSA